MEEIIRVENLTHTYGAGTPFCRSAVQDMSLDIYRGEFLGIIGHTGSGKSTLIQHLNGLLKPTTGRILLGGSAGNDHALVRWNDDGTLDAGFGSGGIVRTDVAGGFDMIRALVVQDDGRILAGGYSTQAGSGIDFTLLRYLASGSLDTWSSQGVSE